MVNYNKCVIYKIVTGNDIYIGSTTNFKTRKYQHKQCINPNNKKSKMKLYQNIRLNNNQWDMIPIKEFSCESKLQLTIEEERCRIEYGATLNSQCCGTGIEYIDKEQYKKDYSKYYYENNKEQIVIKDKERYEKNKEEVLKKKRERYQVNKDEILVQKKDYYIANKDKIAIKKKAYYQANKDKFKERYHANKLNKN